MSREPNITGDVFDRIAPSWYNYRHWTIFRHELESLARRWQKGRLLNVGCGHGADFLPFRSNLDLYGMDISAEMLKFARKYANKFKFSVNLAQADARCLPYPDKSFDWAIAIATYHHLKGEKERLAALVELRRVLKPGSEAFITVWNRWQPKFWFKGREIQVPWRVKDEILYRYYYLFTYSELERLATRAGFRILESSPERAYRFPVKLFSRNICLLVKKEEEGLTFDNGVAEEAEYRSIPLLQVEAVVT